MSSALLKGLRERAVELGWMDAETAKKKFDADYDQARVWLRLDRVIHLLRPENPYSDNIIATGDTFEIPGIADHATATFDMNLILTTATESLQRR